MDRLKGHIWFACLLFSYAKTTVGTESQRNCRNKSETCRHLIIIIIIKISAEYSKIDELQIITLHYTYKDFRKNISLKCQELIC